ncbi:response regulator, partial [Anoxybacillus sp. LAT_38]|nr:response regulator [Anoxybacillus sp. LAT_38]
MEAAWRMLRDARPDLVLLGGIKEAERGVLCQQFRLAFPHLAFIAACGTRELAWEPFFRNLGIWVIAKPIQPGQLEALAMQLASLQVLPMGGVQAGGAPSFAGETGPTPGLHAAEARPVQPYLAGRSSTKHLITVYGPKGGVGKTFLSRELAVYFSLQK